MLSVNGGSSVASDEVFINEIFQHQCLWNPQFFGYKLKRVVEDMWSEVASRLGYSVEGAKLRWEELKKSYVEYKQSKISSAMAEAPKVHFIYALPFLDPFIEEEICNSENDSPELIMERQTELHNMIGCSSDYSTPAQIAHSFSPSTSTHTQRYCAPNTKSKSSATTTYVDDRCALEKSYFAGTMLHVTKAQEVAKTPAQNANLQTASTFASTSTHAQTSSMSPSAYKSNTSSPMKLKPRSAPYPVQTGTFASSTSTHAQKNSRSIRACESNTPKHNVTSPIQTTGTFPSTSTHTHQGHRLYVESSDSIKETEANMQSLHANLRTMPQDTQSVPSSSGLQDIFISKETFSSSPSSIRSQYHSEALLHTSPETNSEMDTSETAKTKVADKYFLLSLLPALNSLPEREKLSKKMQIIKLLKKDT